MTDANAPSRTPAAATQTDGIRIAQRTLTAVALLALIGTVLGLLLVDRIGTTYRSGLELAQDGAGVTVVNTQSIAVLADDVAALALNASVTLQQASELVTLAVGATADVGTALGTNLATSVDGIVGISNGLAGFIEAVERLIPGDSESLAEDLRAIADGLEPLPEQLRTLGAQLATTSGALSDSTSSIDLGVRQLEELSTSIAEAQSSLAEVERVANDIATRADEALERSDRDLLLFRLLILVIGVGVIGVCFASHRALGALGRREAAAAA